MARKLWSKMADNELRAVNTAYQLLWTSPVMGRQQTDLIGELLAEVHEESKRRRQNRETKVELLKLAQ